jgi:hypothetical protein
MRVNTFVSVGHDLSVNPDLTFTYLALVSAIPIDPDPGDEAPNPADVTLANTVTTN